jgi:DNA modification methylase
LIRLKELFVGSGRTLVAAQDLDRNAVGFGLN